MIALSVASVMLGRTVTNTLILTHYPVSVLPYFYFAQAIVLIATTMLTGHFQTQNPVWFTRVFNWIAIVSLLLFSLLIKANLPFAPFIISVLVLTITAVIPVIAWNMASDIFDIQEYKLLSKWLQASGTLGVIVVGSLVGIFSKIASSFVLLLSMTLIGFLSVLCIRSLLPYLPASPAPKKQNISNASLNKTPIYKHLTLLIILSFCIVILVDYYFKMSLAKYVKPKDITSVVTLLFVISNIGTLIVQILLFDPLFQRIGGKKIIFIFPLGLLVPCIISLFFPDFKLVAAIFITNEILYFSVFSLSKNLYLNTLPSILNNLARLKLNGIIKPISYGLASFFSLSLAFIGGGMQPGILLIIFFCLCMVYLSRILAVEYSEQLMASIQMHRFNPELIVLQHENPDEIETMFEQAITKGSVDTILFILQLLQNDINQPVPKCIHVLLQSKDVDILIQTIKLLLLHGDKLELVEEAMNIFSATKEDQVRWYLALYLIEKKQSLLSYAARYETSKSEILLAISCLIYLRQGDFQQQIKAMKKLIEMLDSSNDQQKIYFLFVLHEIHTVRKEGYFIKLIDEDNSAIKTHALQEMEAEVENKVSKTLLETLIHHLGMPSIAMLLNNLLIRIGEPAIELLEKKFKQTDSYYIKASCIVILSQIQGVKAERSLIHMFHDANFNVVITNNIAKSLAYRGVKLKMGEPVRSFLTGQIISEVTFYQQLCSLLVQVIDSAIAAEITSRIYFIKKRVLYYMVAISGIVELLGCLSPLLDSFADKRQQAIALELIDSKIENRNFVALINELFTEKKPESNTHEQKIQDPWLMNFIDCVQRNSMTSFYKLIKLRKTDLFKNFALEALQAIGECAISRDMAKDEIIFSEGEIGDGLYIIDTGEVIITKQGKQLAKLTEGAYFGELALIVDHPRFATATAGSEGSLLYIDKLDFDSITDEMPEIMKNITRQIIHYLVVSK